jgi:hypothetical protein
MNILIVNISKTHMDGVQEAMSRAWPLDRDRLQNVEYVVGVARGHIYDVFALLEINVDEELPDRFSFELEVCDEAIKQEILDGLERKNIKYVSTKYLEL